MTFLINTFDQIYTSGAMMGLSKLIGYSAGGLVVRKIGVRQTFLVGFGLATFGGAMILFYGLKH